MPSFTEKFLVVLFASHCLPKLIRQIVSYFILAYVALNVDILFDALSGIYKQTVFIKCLFHLLEGLLANVRGSARFNRVGGAYQNGKPIPEWLPKMISLAQNGACQCDISRRFRITHGCVSKILSTYQRTNYFEPGRERDAKVPTIATSRELRTDVYMQDESGLFSRKTRRDGLRHHNPCGEGDLYGLSSIRRSLLQTGTVGQKTLGTSQEQGDGGRSPMIANILNLSSNEQSTKRRKESQPRTQGLSCALLTLFLLTLIDFLLKMHI